jgi:hypothetical protein
MTEPLPKGRSGLTSWMAGVRPGHPLNEAWMWPPFLDAMDEIITSLEVAQPLRLSRKRAAFRALQSFDAVLEQRAELVVGALLARAGIPFEFAADHPDLVFAQGRYGIEVGTRAIDGPWAIHHQLEASLADRPGLHVVLSFDQRPLKIAAAEVARVVDSVVGQAYTQPTTALRYDGAGLTVKVMTDTGISSSRVVIEFQSHSNSELTGHMNEVEREIDNKIAEKRRQAQKMPAILLVDVSAWVGPGYDPGRYGQRSSVAS